MGDIKFDQGSGTLYEAHFAGGDLQMAAFRNALADDVQTALTPEASTIAGGVDMLSHWPAIDVDAAGNLYIAWGREWQRSPGRRRLILALNGRRADLGGARAGR